MYQTQQQASPPPPCPGLPKPQRPKGHFRWGIVTVVLTALFMCWVFKGIEPSFEFEELMRAIKIQHPARFIRLVCLMVIGLAVVLAIRLFARNDQK